MLQNVIYDPDYRKHFNIVNESMIKLSSNRQYIFPAVKSILLCVKAVTNNEPAPIQNLFEIIMNFLCDPSSGRDLKAFANFNIQYLLNTDERSINETVVLSMALHALGAEINYLGIDQSVMLFNELINLLDENYDTFVSKKYQTDFIIHSVLLFKQVKDSSLANIKIQPIILNISTLLKTKLINHIDLLLYNDGFNVAQKAFINEILKNITSLNLITTIKSFHCTVLSSLNINNIARLEISLAADSGCAIQFIERFKSMKLNYLKIHYNRYQTTLLLDHIIKATKGTNISTIECDQSLDPLLISLNVFTGTPITCFIYKGASEYADKIKNQVSKNHEQIDYHINLGKEVTISLPNMVNDVKLLILDYTSEPEYPEYARSGMLVMNQELARKSLQAMQQESSSNYTQLYQKKQKLK